MAKENTSVDAGILRAFQAYEAQARIANTKIGCFLVVILMPAGVLLDMFVYPGEVAAFFKIRLACSVLAGAIWAMLYTDVGRRSHRLLGIIVPMLPTVFIAWMIAITEGFASPYYAGLNLVLLAVGAVLHWTFVESLIATALVFAIYVVAGIIHLSAPGSIAPSRGIVVNNFYFIALMDVIVVIGTYFQYRSRLREFVLRHELDENRKKLEEGNQRLVQMDRIKSEFFANMSHELRTPLTLLLAPLETILHGRAHGFDSETRSLLQTMHANGMRLLKLINDLLDLEKLESRRVQIKREPVSIPDFVRGLVSSVQGVARDKRLNLKTIVGENVGVISADRDKLEKIVLNLLFNALKFTAAGGEVTLKAERRDSTLVMQVQDTGTGIAENQLPFIFDRFWQADTSSQRKYQGTGIGLSLVKELVEAHGGTVTAQSQLGKGTTMTIELPYEEVHDAPGIKETPTLPAVAAPAGGNGESKSEEWLANLYRRAELFPALTPLQETLRPEEIAASGKPRLLIADDEPDMLRFLKSQMAPHYDVIEAVDGLQAVEKAAQFLPQIIITDMMMPEKDGLQVCREVRAKTSTQGIPIILVTARADEETKLNALKAGASDFLSKPFSTTELHLRVKNLVDQNGLQRKLAKQNQILESTLEELKEAQAQLVHAEKMASLGRMSAGIIHEINNPLNYAKTGLYSLRKKQKHLPETERGDFDEVIHDIEEGVDRVKNIVSDLRTFTHPNSEQLEAVDVNKIVTSALRFLSDQRKDIRIEENVPAGFTVYGNSNKLVQVLVNLLQNAIDALNRKKTQNAQPTIWIEARQESGKNLLVIRDNGEGIPPDVIGKIFDPFFTTKDVGEGMGLGLSISYRIIEECGGRISVKSEVGNFTEFTLEFPSQCKTIRGNDLG